MSYDLKRLKGAADRRIPPVDPASLRERLMNEPAQGRRMAGPATALAAVLAAVMLLIWFGVQTGPRVDYVSPATPAQEILAQEKELAESAREESAGPEREAGPVWEWLDSFGKLGAGVLLASALWLIVRLSKALATGESGRFLTGEMGWALAIAALLILGYRPAWQTALIRLHPVETDTGGSLALALAGALGGMGAALALASAWKGLRRPWIMAGLAVFCAGLPWAIKALAVDMSVRDWAAASWFFRGTLIGAAAIGVRRGKWLRGLAGRMEKLDEQNKRRRGGGWVWGALALAALLNFTLGAALSGQALEGVETSWRRVSWAEGAMSREDAAWIHAVNDFRRTGEAADGASLPGAQWAVKWLEENGLDELAPDMVYEVIVNGKVGLKKKGAGVLLRPLLAGDEALLLMSEMYADPENASTRWVVLAPAGRENGIRGVIIEIAQPGEDWVASQRNYWCEVP